MRKTIPIELFGYKLYVSERSAQDVLTLMEFSASADHSDARVILYETAKVIESSLKINYEDYSFRKNPFSFFKKRIFKEKLSAKNLLKELSPKELSELHRKVIIELEGVKEGKTPESEDRPKKKEE